MREELILDVPHRQLVFTVPKMLRIFFKYKRSFLSALCLCGKEAILKYLRAVAGKEITSTAKAESKRSRWITWSL